MSIAERARELLEKQRLSVAHNLAWLVQALLAERRLAIEFAAKFIEDPANHWALRYELARALRAAAEKELDGHRGGE